MEISCLHVGRTTKNCVRIHKEQVFYSSGEEREGKILGKLMVKHLAYKRATTRNGRGEAEVGFDLIKTGSDNSDAVN